MKQLLHPWGISKRSSQRVTKDMLSTENHFNQQSHSGLSVMVPLLEAQDLDVQIQLQSWI